MKSRTKQIALCGVMTAVSVVILLMGAVLGLGIYLAPMVAGVILMPVGKRCGTRYHVMLWLAVSMLAFMLVPEIEENLMYAMFFGWYPILRQMFDKMSKWLRVGAKLAVFNVSFALVEYLVMWILVPQAAEPLYLAVLLLLGNAMFLCYDRAIPNVLLLLERYLGKLMH